MSQGGEAPAILVEAVSKRFRSVTAVDRLDLSVRQGEVFCLFGPNGSGKTTFLRMLAGYISPSAGRITVAGHDVVRDSLAARRKIGYVPETVPLYGHMRVGEFLRFMARLRGVAADAVEAGVERVVRLLALGEVVRKPIRVLSRGYRQRTALAQALVHEPEILVLDEPTNGLDPRQIIEMRGLIRSLAGRHTILMIAVSQYARHPITRGLALSIYPGARPVDAVSAPHATAMVLFSSSAQSYRIADRLSASEEAASAPRGAIPLAAAAEGRIGSGDPFRLVVFGDADFASNSFFPYLANADMVLGSLSWLIREERAPVVKPPVEVLPTVVLTGSQVRAIFIATVLVLPGSVALLGGLVWWRRRA